MSVNTGAQGCVVGRSSTLSHVCLVSPLTALVNGDPSQCKLENAGTDTQVCQVVSPGATARFGAKDGSNNNAGARCRVLPQDSRYVSSCSTALHQATAISFWLAPRTSCALNSTCNQDGACCCVRRALARPIVHAGHGACPSCFLQQYDCTPLRSLESLARLTCYDMVQQAQVPCLVIYVFVFF
jgi:hypothetical protein